MRFLKQLIIFMLAMFLLTSCVSVSPAGGYNNSSEGGESISSAQDNSLNTTYESSESSAYSETSDYSESSEDESSETESGEQESSEVSAEPTLQDLYLQIDENRERLDGFMTDKLDFAFFGWIYNHFGNDVINSITESVKEGSYGYDLLYHLTGMTGKVLYDEFLERYSPQSSAYESNIIKQEAKNGGNTVIVICGDISLADNWRNMTHLTKTGKSITDFIDEGFLSEMRSADITLANNEFAISERGTPLEGKTYTLKAKPENIEMYKTIGVNLVSLANNHVYDYGKEAFLDTLDSLKDEGIPYIGGGGNIEEAMKPQYYIINGRKIAFVAGNRSEKYIFTPAAGNDTPGVLRCYETELMKQSVSEAKGNADFVVAYLHWGDEFEDKFNKTQQSQGYEYIDAGADLVVGSHTHCLQGAEFYKGKPIVYSLGNFWFSGNKEEMGMLKININSEGSAEYCIIPGREDSFSTLRGKGNDLKTLLDYFEGISKDISISEDGHLMPGSPEKNYTTNVTDKEKLEKLKALADYIDADGRISVYFRSSDGSYFTAGTNKKLICASTIKGPYSLYLLKMADKGELDLNEELELKEDQIWRGAGIIKNSPVGTKYTVRELIKLAIEISDNTAYKMLIDRFGTAGFNKYAASMGYGISLIRGNGYGYCTSEDMGKLYYEIYEYQGENSGFLIDCLLNTKYSEQIEKALSKYPVAQKYGNQGGSSGYHDVAIVYSPTPFVLSVFTTIDADSQNATQPFRYIATEIDRIFNG